MNAVKLVKSYDDAVEILPPDPKARTDVLSQLAHAVEARLPATRVRLDGLLEKLDGNAREPLNRAAEGALADLELGEAAPWCAERSQCAEVGLAAVERLGALEPGTCAPAILRARLYVASDDAARGLHDLEEAAQGAADSADCWKWLGQLAAQTKNEVFVSVSEEELSRAGCSVDAECTNNLMWIANLEEQRGNARRAIKYYERAHERAPDRVDIVERLAAVCAAHALHAQALDAYHTLQRLTGDARWGAAAEREKAVLYGERTVQELGVGDAGAPRDRAAPSSPQRGFSSAFEHPFGDRDGRRGGQRGSSSDDSDDFR
jgi:tetratricopeptide (TPR) repeat protein